MTQTYETADKTKSCKEIGKEIRETIKKLYPKVKLSVVTDYNHISVYLLESPFNVTVLQETLNSGYTPVNRYYYETDERLTPKCIELFNEIDKVIKKYFWDESDSMTDYFHCAFYFDYEIGKWDKHFKLI